MKFTSILNIFSVIVLLFLIGCQNDKLKFEIIFIGSKNCNACIEMKIILYEILQEYKHKIKVIFYDIESHEGYNKYKEYNGKSIPFMIFFNKNKKIIFISNSKMPKDAIIAILKTEGLK